MNIFKNRVGTCLFIIITTISCNFLTVLEAKQTESKDQLTKFAVGNMKFTLPEEWQKIKTSSPLRSAQLIHRDEETGKKIDIIFFYFGHQFNSKVYENMDRWKKQFTNLEKEEVFLGFNKEKNVHYLLASGTYNRSIPGGTVTPVTGSALLGAIIENKRGNIYVKMTGPSELVEKSKIPFRAMVEGKTTTKIEEEIQAVELADKEPEGALSKDEKAEAKDTKKSKESKGGGH